MISAHVQAEIEQMLGVIRRDLHVSGETEAELLAELRTHLEDALETAVAAGMDEARALQQVADDFGISEVGPALQAVHAPWESADAVIACILPVLGALLLRWTVFAPSGTAVGWRVALVQPAFWVIALIALILPVLQFSRWRYALVSWSIFWALTLIFMLLPTAQAW